MPRGESLDKCGFSHSGLAANKNNASAPCVYALEYNLQLIKEFFALK